MRSDWSMCDKGTWFDLIMFVGSLVAFIELSVRLGNEENPTTDTATDENDSFTEGECSFPLPEVVVTMFALTMLLSMNRFVALCTQGTTQCWLARPIGGSLLTLVLALSSAGIVFVFLEAASRDCHDVGRRYWTYFGWFALCYLWLLSRSLRYVLDRCQGREAPPHQHAGQVPIELPEIGQNVARYLRRAGAWARRTVSGNGLSKAEINSIPTVCYFKTLATIEEIDEEMPMSSPSVSVSQGLSQKKASPDQVEASPSCSVSSLSNAGRTSAEPKPTYARPTTNPRSDGLQRLRTEDDELESDGESDFEPRRRHSSADFDEQRVVFVDGKNSSHRLCVSIDHFAATDAEPSYSVSESSMRAPSPHSNSEHDHAVSDGDLELAQSYVVDANAAAVSPQFSAAATAAATAAARSNDMDNVSCLICSEPFAMHDPCKVLPNCAHKFHAECATSWLREHPNCPRCDVPVIGSPQSGVVTNPASAAARPLSPRPSTHHPYEVTPSTENSSYQPNLPPIVVRSSPRSNRS